AFLEPGQARARGQTEHMAAACPVGSQKVEMPARHIDGARGRREAEPDQSAVDTLERMDDLLRFDHVHQGAVRRRLLGFAANGDGAELPIYACGEDAPCAMGQGVEGRLELLQRLPSRNRAEGLRAGRRVTTTADGVSSEEATSCARPSTVPR